MLKKLPVFFKVKSDLITFLFFALFNLTVLAPLFFNSGELFFRDFTFPIFQDSFREYHVPVWNWQRDTSNISSLYRFFARSPFLILSFVLPISTVLKIYLFSTVLIGQISFYYFQKKILKINSNFVIVATSLFFTLNTRVVDFLWETSLVWSYSFTPLFITLFSYSLEQEKRLNKFTLFSSLVLLSMFVHPYSFAATFGLSIIWFLFISKIKTLRYRVISLAYLGLTHILLSFYFVLPFITSWIYGGPITPETKGFYKYSLDVVNYLSSTQLIDELSLVRGVIKFVDYYPSNSLLLIAWYICSLLVVVGTIVFASIYSLGRKNVHRNVTSVYVPVFILGLILSFGSDGLTGFVYRFILDILPTNFIWLFRSPLKIQLYLFIPLTILLSITLNSFLIRLDISSRAKKFSKYMITLVLVFYSIFTISGYFFESRFVPVNIPQEYYEINDLFSNISDTKKVVYLPRYNERETLWGGNRLFQPWDLISSQQPTVSYWWSDPEVFDYIYNGIYSKRRFENICNYLAPIGVDYLVFHNDRVVPFRNFDEVSINQLKTLYSKNIIYNKNDWFVFDFKCSEKYIISRKPNIKLETDLNFESKLYKTFNLVNAQNTNSFDTDWSLVENNKIPASYTLSNSQKLVKFNDLQKSLYYLDNDTYDKKDANAVYFKAKDFVYEKEDLTEVVQNPNLTIKTINSVKFENNLYKISPAVTDALDNLYNVETDIINVDSNKSIHIKSVLRGANLTFPHLTYILLDKEGERVYKKEIPVSYSVQAIGGESIYTIDEIIKTTNDTKSIIVKLKGSIPSSKESYFEVENLEVNAIDRDKLLNNDTKITFDNIDNNYSVFAKVLKSPFEDSVKFSNDLASLTVDTNIDQGLDSYQYEKIGSVDKNNNSLELNVLSMFAMHDLVLIPNAKTSLFNNYLTFKKDCSEFSNSLKYDELISKDFGKIGLCSNKNKDLLSSLQASIKQSEVPLLEAENNVITFKSLEKDNDIDKTSIQVPLLYRAGLQTEDSDKIESVNSVMLGYDPDEISNNIKFSYIQDNFFYLGLSLSILTLIIYILLVYYTNKNLQK